MLEKLLQSVEIIQALGDNPNTDDGLSSEELKMKFDEAARIIKSYLNDILVPYINKQSEALSKELDPSLTRDDLAAQAKAVGDALKNYLPKSGGTMSGAIAMGGNKITGLGAPTQSADAVNKEYADKMLPKSGGVMTGHMLSNLGSQNEDISGGYVAAERRAFVEAYEGNNIYGPRRQLILSSRSAEADIKNALLFQQIGDTEQTVYTIYGTHNPPGMTLLWQNASPSSSFPAQVLSIPAMAKYNAIVMLFNRTGGDTFVSMAHRYTAESLSQTVSSVRYVDGAFYASSRPIGISFENCAISFGDGLQNGVVHNARAIPYAVYGL